MSKLESKIEGFVADCGCDAVIAVGVDNFNYLTRTVLPFANYYPDRKAVAVFTKDGRKMVLCPFDWVDAIKDQGWGGEITPYDESTGDPLDPIIITLKETLNSLNLARSVIGIDVHRVSKNFADLLSHSLPEVEWKPVDPLLKEIRVVKTKEEVELIERAAKQLDRGIIHALNHLEGTVHKPGYTIAEFSERVRVHICENGASGIGHVATTLGSNSRRYYAPLRGQFLEGELFRVDVSNHYLGYWANLGRMAVTGVPTAEQAGAFEENLMLKFVAEDMLKPGVRCDEIYTGVKETAVKCRIPLWDEVSVGHGVGVSHHEPPYIDQSNMTELKPGMVLALDIYTKGPENELIHSKDIYEVTEEGARLLSWYRIWDRLYEVTGFRAAH